MNLNDEPSEPKPPQPPPIGGIAGLDPGELLARALNTAQPSPGAAHWSPPAPEELARLLPQYHIESLLGHGGMGAVYKGRQAALDRAVAIKLLPAEMAGDAQFIARFQREARTLARLQHPGIVAVHDFGQTAEGHLYFVMEFVDGTDLHRILHGPGLNPAQALELISQICEALHYAHGKGVIHRDIKPGNILVTTESRAKLADFGLSRPIKEESTMLTGTNVIMGTADYMAPEQQEGHADQRADIYALGVMLYEMLCGQRPRGAFDPPSHRVQVDVRLDDVVLKAMQQQPERRYQQVSEMKTDVDRIRTTPPQVKPAPKPKRKPLAALAVIAVIAVIAALLALAGVASFLVWRNAQTAPGGTRSRASQTSAAVGEKDQGRAGARPSESTFATATKDAPFVNTLGMKLVPVPITYSPAHQPPLVPSAASAGPTGGQRGSPQGTGQPLVPGTATSVLFSVWETRVQDYELFVIDTKRQWPRPTFPQEPTHPAVNMTWHDAQAFCTWLTERERKAGKLGATDLYRLPSDHEWSCAVGIGERENAPQSPQDKHAKIADVFPWGTAWPPPPGAGNYSGAEAAGHLLWSKQVIMDNYRDEAPQTAPAGRSTANRFGLHDLGGNVWEWCEDVIWPGATNRVLRGASFSIGDARFMFSSNRNSKGSQGTSMDCGFRVVLAVTPTTATLLSIPATPGTAAVAPVEVWQDATRRFGPSSSFSTGGGRFTIVKQGVWSVPDGPHGDAAIRVRAPFSAALRDFKLIVRRTGNTQYYAYVLADGIGAQIQIATDGKFSPLSGGRATPLPVLLRPGEAVEFELRVVGPKLSARVNGQVVFEGEDSSLPAGGPGFSWGTADASLAVDALEYLDLGGVAPAASAPAATDAAEGWVRVLDQPRDHASRHATILQDGWIVRRPGIDSGTRVLPFEMRDGAVRAEFRVARPRPGDLLLRVNGEVRYALTCRGTQGQDTIRLQYRNGKETIELGTFTIEPRLSSDATYTLELRAVGRTLSARLDGKEVIRVEDARLDRGSTSIYVSENGAVRNVEVLNLDPPGGTRSGASQTSAPTGEQGRAGARPSEATKDAPFVNTLGMKFVPVPITGGPSDVQRGSPQGIGPPPVPGAATSVLFSVWETRVQDYEIFATEARQRLPKQEFPQGPTHPVLSVSWDDAQAFCKWLTERERKAGKLSATEGYRLPSDHEWSCAVGIGDREDPAKTPEEKSAKIVDVYPWGTVLPPPLGAGNYSGQEVAGEERWKGQGMLRGYRDDFPETAPVGSFTPTPLGLFDLGGNAREWCEDWHDEKQEGRVMRGAAFDMAAFLLSSSRVAVPPSSRLHRSGGFRVVLAPVADGAPKVPSTPVPVSSSAAATPTPPPSAATPAPATPAPQSVTAKWLAEQEPQWQAAFAKEVSGPFEKGVGDLKKQYLAAVETQLTAATKAAKLEEVAAFRAERERMNSGGDVPAEDEAAAPAALNSLRASYRTARAKLDAERFAKAKAIHARYDAILGQNLALLTQRERVDEALLLKAKREQMTKAWLAGAAAPAPVSFPAKATAPAAPTPALPARAVTATPVPLVPRQHVLTKLELKELLESTEWTYFTSPEPDTPPTGSIIFHREGKRGSCLSNNAFNAIVWYETQAPDLILIYHTGTNAPKPLVRVFRLDDAARVARFEAALSNIAGKGCIKFKGPAKSR